MANRMRRRCSVASNSKGYYAEDFDKDNDTSLEGVTPGKDKSTVDSNQISNNRRSARVGIPNKKFGEDFDLSSSIHRKRASEMNTASSDSDQSCLEDNAKSGIITAKQKGDLFEDLTDVEGKHLFGFNTPKKRDGMVMKALSTPKTPQTPKTNRTSKTPNSGKCRDDFQIKTPSRVRNKVKLEISKLLEESSDSERDFSPDESDYSASEASVSEESTGGSDKDVSEHSDEDSKTKRTDKKIKSLTRLSSVQKNVRSQAKSSDYIPRSEGYFIVYANKKIVTSDHTLNRLKNPRLPHTQLFSLLKNMKISTKHEKCMKSLLATHKSYFSKWMHILDEGYNILLYGLGSKRELLQTFHNDVLRNQPVIVVNGFFPSITVKDILDAIICDILEMSVYTSNQHEVFDAINGEFSKMRNVHLFVIIHNIDGVMLRSHKAQDVLSRLATVPNIHLIASIDHINTPLLWDHLSLSNYNFSWWDVTSLIPYEDETCFENSLLVQSSTDLALSSMNHVFQSLTTNARKVFMLIVTHQLNSKENPNHQGIAFKDLYAMSRESFLVSSDLALRAQLTEFLDHKLIKSKRASDGTEYLKIPIAASLLQQFFEQNNN